MRIIATIIFALLVFSCSDDKTAPTDFMKAEKDQILWEGKVTAESHSEFFGDTLFISGTRTGSRKNTMEALVMKIRFTGAGRYSLQKNQGTYYTVLEGDMIINEYKTDDGIYEGVVEVTHYDEAKKVIEGNFEVVLKMTGSQSADDPDAISFTTGQFKATIK